MEKELKYLNKSVKIFKYHSESENYFNQRLEFLKKLEISNVNFKDAVKFSKIWSNIKFKECRYNLKVYNNIKKFDKNI
tara:strand:- start:91 stop:324 length:234 start_codon:yes stop_codon:yes gene_type:complete